MKLVVKDHLPSDKLISHVKLLEKKHFTCQIVNCDLGKKLVAILRPYVSDLLIAPRIEMNNLFVRENDGHS
jgi:hypothetical protein